jgi:rhodanese-related sulfurtransferase
VCFSTVKSKDLLRGTFVILLLSIILGVAVNFSLVRRFVRGEFTQGFLAQEKFPGIRFITLAEAEDLFARAGAVFIDSRSREEYAVGHVPGALNISLEENKQRLSWGDLPYPLGQTLVVYCEGGDCQTSLSLAKLIHEQGFRDIRIFTGGWTGWSAAGLPVEPPR